MLLASVCCRRWRHAPTFLWRNEMTRQDCSIAMSSNTIRRANSPLLLRCRLSFLVPLLDVSVGSERRLRIPAREVILAGRPPEAISLHNIISGTVRRIESDPSRRAVIVEIALPDGALLARVTPDAIVRLALTPGRPGLGADQIHVHRVLGA